MFYPASVGKLYRPGNTNEIVPECKWNENVKSAFAAVRVRTKRCALALVGPGLRLLPVVIVLLLLVLVFLGKRHCFTGYGVRRTLDCKVTGSNARNS
eukprot:992602-Rhodomonas_salina.1